jgi:hypothetical protein
MLSYSETELTSVFFRNVKIFKELSDQTDDKIFKKYADGFLYTNLEFVQKNIRAKISANLAKQKLLKNYYRNLDDYELRVSETNWFHQSREELERNQAIYAFLLQNSKFSQRKVAIARLTREYNNFVDEYNALLSLKTNAKNRKYFEDLKTINSLVKPIAMRLKSFAEAHPEHPFVQKYNIVNRFIDKAFIESHIDELLALEPKSQEKQTLIDDSQTQKKSPQNINQIVPEQLSIFDFE